MEVIVVTIIVLLAAGLTGRALFRKLTGRDAKGKCDEVCQVADECTLECCEPITRRDQSELPCSSPAGNHKRSTPA